MGKTEGILDLVGHRLAQRPAPILYVGPAKQFLTEQFEPRVMNLLDESEALALLVARGKRMTKTRKVIAGVPFRLAHAGSSAALKSDPAALALVDEYDEMLKNIKGQGDPLGLVERRGDTYPEFVCVVTSTCTKGMVGTYHDEGSGLTFWKDAPPEDVESPIWRLWQQGTRHHWAWPCPHCGEYFIPRFALVHYPANATPREALTATYIECPRCGGVIEERHKAWMNARGRYVAPGQAVDRTGEVTGEPPAATSLSFWVSGFASPFVTFGERVAAYLEAVALADPDKIQTAINAGFGELYSPGGQNLKDWQTVAARRLAYRFGEVPEKVVRITMAVDVQKTGLFYSLRGWGERGTSWLIEADELRGFTNEPEVWGLAADVLRFDYEGLHVQCCLVDSGFRPNKPEEGWTNSVYEFCARFKRVARATKGYDQLAAPIMRGTGKVTIPGRGVQPVLELVRLDTDFWKCRLMERLAWPAEQPGGFWLSADASDDYCKQMVSEVRTLTPSGKPLWVQVSRRNHYLDVEAMQEAAGHLIGAQKIPIGMTRAQMFAAQPVESVKDLPEGAVEQEPMAPQPPAEPKPAPALPRAAPWVDRRGWFSGR